MILVTYITRTQSSGFESRTNKVFDTLEQAAEYIHGEWYDSFCEINDYPVEWNEEDLGRPMPKREEFSLEAIKKARSGKFIKKVLFDPYSQYCGLVQNELHLEEHYDENKSKEMRLKLEAVSAAAAAAAAKAKTAANEAAAAVTALRQFVQDNMVKL